MTASKGLRPALLFLSSRASLTMATSRKDTRNGTRHAQALNSSLPKYVRVAMITANDTTTLSVGEVCSHPV
jgi:hypothetical protein